MSDIDNLNFKVILDDQEFNDKVEKDIKAAKRLNVALSDYLTVKSKIKGNNSGLSARETAERKRQIDLNTKEAVSQEKVTQAKLKTAKAQAQLNRVNALGTSQYSAHSRLLGELGTLAAGYFSIRGVSAFVSSLVEVTGQYEAQRAALRAILQDESGADKLLAQFQDLALISPYTFQSLTGYAKQLAAFGVPLDEIYDTTKRLADVSSGVGVDLSRIILAYGQVRSASFLKGSELRQFTEAGIPLLEMLAEQFTKIEGKAVSVGDVFDKISARQVPFEMVAQAFKTMTDEGGKFYNMQEVLAETVQGKVSNLKDAYEKMLYTIGEDQSGIIKGAVDGLKTLMENYETVGKILAGLVTTYGSYKAALMAVNALHKAKVFVAEYMAMGKALGFATANMAALNAASKANIYIALASAVLGVVTALVSFNKKKQEALTESGKAAQAYEEEAKALKSLYDVASDESKSKDERREAISKINKEYGEYLDSLIDERDSVDKLAESYDKLTKVLGTKYLQQQKELLTGTQRAEFNDAQSALYGSLSEILKESGIGDEMQGKITGEIQGIISRFSRYWSSQDIYNKIIEKLSNAGGYASGRQRGKLFDSIKEFKETENALLIAENSYNQFARGYEASMKAIRMSSASTVEEVRTTIDDIIKRIESGNAAIAEYEKRAKAQGLTDKERKELKALREQNDEDRKEYKELAGVDYTKTAKATDKQSQILKDQAKRLAREAVEAEDEITRASVEAMDEGFKKKMALLELQHKQRIQQIVWDYEDEAAKSGESPELTSQFAKRLTSEEIRHASEVAVIEKESNRQRLESQREYMKEYGSLKEKELAIIQEYEQKIAQAKADGDAYLVKTLERQRDEEIDNLKNRYSGLYALIFADAQDLTSSQLAKAIEVTQTEIKKAADSGDIEELAELYERLRDMMSEQDNRKYWGFGGLAEGFKQMKQSESSYLASFINNDKDGMEGAIADRVAALALIEKSADEISEAIGGLGEALESFGGVVGEIGASLSGLASNTDNIITAFTQKDNKGAMTSAAISSTLQIAEMIGSQIVENRKAQEEWNETVKQCAHEYAMFQLAALDYQQANIFGVESPYKKAIDSMYQYAEAMKYLKEQQDTLSEGQVQTGTKKAISGKNLGTGLAAGAGLGAAVGSIIPGLGTALGAAIGAAVGGIAGALTTKTVPVFESLADTYGSILKEGTDSFELNPQILADYDKLDDATKQIIDNWEQIRDKAKEAEENMRESLSAMVGDMGNQLSNMLIEAFKDGNVYAAIDDFNAYVTDMIGNITQQLIFAAIFEKQFEDLQKSMEASFGEGGDMDITDDIAQFAERVPGMLDDYENAMRQAQKKWESLGYNAFSPETSSTSKMGSSIQGVTENTAGLLASYVNAMRADVLMQRQLLAQHLPIISCAMPTIMDHLAQIQANTANINDEALRIARSNEEILYMIRSVITYDSGDASIRTY